MSQGFTCFIRKQIGVSILDPLTKDECQTGYSTSVGAPEGNTNHQKFNVDKMSELKPRLE